MRPVYIHVSAKLLIGLFLFNPNIPVGITRRYLHRTPMHVCLHILASLIMYRDFYIRARTKSTGINYMASENIKHSILHNKQYNFYLAQLSTI